MGLQYKEFAALFPQVKHEALHLEMRDSYGTEAEIPHLAKWAAGEPDDLGWLQPWCTLVRDATTDWVRFLGLPDDAEAATAARLARQKVLRSSRRRLIAVLAEQTLRTRLGTPQVMAAQLEYLLEVMRLPNVSVGIIPAMAERYTVAQVPFWIWDDARVTVETVSARLEITRPDEIALYATVFERMF